MLKNLFKIAFIALIIIIIVDFGVFLYSSPSDRAISETLINNYINWSNTRFLTPVK